MQHFCKTSQKLIFKLKNSNYLTNGKINWKVKKSLLLVNNNTQVPLILKLLSPTTLFLLVS